MIKSRVRIRKTLGKRRRDLYTLTRGDELELVSWHVRNDSTVLVNVKCLEHGDEEVTLDPVVLTVKAFFFLRI